MSSLVDLLSKWEADGRPDGAMFSIGYGGQKQPLPDLFKLGSDVATGNHTFVYYDPPEVWMNVDAPNMLIKLRYHAQIRCREKTRSIDDAWNDWYSIGGILLEDAYKYEYQYLAGSEKY